MKINEEIVSTLITITLASMVAILITTILDMILSTPIFIGKTLLPLTNSLIVFFSAIHKINYYLFLIFYLFPAWGLCLIVYVYRKDKERTEIEVNKIKKFNIKQKFILITIAFTTAIVITSYRYLYYPYIQGFDVPMWYIFLIKLASQSWENFINISINWRRPLFVLLMVIFYKVGFSLEIIYFYFPMGTAIFFSASAYYLMKYATNEEIGHIAAITAPISFFFIRLSYDLLANYLVIPIIYLFLGEYLKIKKEKSEKYLKNILYLILCAILAALIHPWTAIAFFSIVLLTEIFNLLIFSKNVTKETLIKEIIFLGIISISLISVMLFTEAINLLLEINQSAISIGRYWMIYRESSIVLILSILGLIVTIVKLREYKHFAVLIAVWICVLSGLLYVPINFFTRAAYRAYILYPIGILQAPAIYFFSSKIENMFTKKIRAKRFKFSNSKMLKVFLCAFLICLSLSSVLPNAIIHEYVYRPDNVTIKQIEIASKLFGFENKSVIYIIFNSPAKPLDPKTSSHIIGWVRAYLGDNIYEGHLLELLNKQPDVRGRILEPENKTIVLCDKLYMLTDFELAFSKEITEGIYIFDSENKTFKELEKVLLTKYHNLYDFYISGKDWHIITRTLNMSLRYIGYSTGLGLFINIHKNAIGWFTIEKYFDSEFNTTDFQSLIIRLYGNATDIMTTFEVYYKSGKVKGRTLSDLMGDGWLIAPITNNDTIIKVRLFIKTKNPIPASEILVLKYLVVI